jgi:hypothetical protein
MGSQRIVMSMRSNGTTDVIAQVNVPPTTDDYGVLIPVPSEPTLDSRPVSGFELNALDYNTAPHIDAPYPDSSGGMSCGCGGGDDSAEGSKGGIVVSDSVNIGPAVAVSLTGDNVDAVSAWLKDNGFLLPDSDSEILARYVSAGSYFIAIRRSEKAPPGGSSSIGIHYKLQGDHRKLSLGFAKLGAASSVAFTLFIAAPAATGPSAPFTALTLNDLDATRLKANDYKSAVETAVAAHDSKAFVLESAVARDDVVRFAPSISLYMDDNTIVTRATTVIARENLSDDAIFTTPFADPIPNSRQASLPFFRTRNASIGSFGILLVAHILRRRGRRRRYSE